MDLGIAVKNPFMINIKIAIGKFYFTDSYFFMKRRRTRMKTNKQRMSLKRLTALFLSGIMLALPIANSVYGVYSYYAPSNVTAEEAQIRDWTWSAEGETAAINPRVNLIPTGLSQQQTGLMGDAFSKFWFVVEKNKTANVTMKDGTIYEVDFSKFNHRYYTCADSHNSGWFAPVGSQMAFKELYYPTDDINTYPQFIKNLPTDMETKKFTLILISLLSASYETPSLDALKDSDDSSMYYYLLWLSIWANDVYADFGAFQGISPEDDWDYVRDNVRVGLNSFLNPDAWGSTAIYDAFRPGGPAEQYFFNCWKAAKFLSSFDYTMGIGTSLKVTDPVLGEDGMYHMTFDYSTLSDYEKEVYRRLEATDLATGWEYENNGSTIDFKSADGSTGGTSITTLKMQESSEEDKFFNTGFGIGGLAGFQGCAKNDKNKTQWGNTQVYFSAVSEPLEILVGGGRTPSDGDWGVEVHRFQHDETWQTHYNVQLWKYDSETGKGLANSKWDILEAFDSSQLDSTDLESDDNWANKSGSQFVKWNGWDYGEGHPDGDVANDPCSWDINVTNEDGFLMLADNDENASSKKAHTDTKSYTYIKGYCGGHPEPEVEESGDPEIDDENEAAAMGAWQAEVDKCEALSAAGGFYHSLNEGEGKAELEADRDSLYEQFIGLTYEYSAIELNPRPGYTVHGSHADDIPIEIKVVTSSEYKDFNAGGQRLAFVDLPKNAKTSILQFDNSDSTTDETRNQEETVKVILEDLEEDIDEDYDELDEDNVDFQEDFDFEEDLATPSNASPSDATPANAKRNLLEQLVDLFLNPMSLIHRTYGIQSRSDDDDDLDLGTVSFEPSEVNPVSPGAEDIVDHTFIVYDHRTEGEIHVNKQDFYLNNGQTDDYNSYGDSVGDGTLEGAAYGLFALKDVIHPDGHTGTIFQKDDLVSVGTSDRNGEISFMAITEAPGTTFNYKTGQIEKSTGGFEGPTNLHKDQAEAEQVIDMENYVGHTSSGGAISLTDSIAGGNEYQKLSSNQSGVSGLTGSFATYPISNNEALNGNCWIGRPLIVEENGTSYYVKELTRSEGYELSVNGKTNLITNGQDNYEKEYQTADVTLGSITLNTEKGGNYFEIKAENVDHDITLQGMKFPAGAAFEISTIKQVPEKIKVPVYSTTQKPVMAVPGSYVYREGQRVEASVGYTVTYPGGQSYAVNAVSDKTDKTIGIKPMNYHTMGTPIVTDLGSGGSTAAFKNLYNAELEALGYREPGIDAPWVRVKLEGSTDLEWINSITQAMVDKDLTYFNSVRISEIEASGSDFYAVIRYEWNLYGDSRDNSVYVPDKDTLYVKKDTGNGYFVYVAYKDLDSNSSVVSYTMKNGFLDRATLKDESVTGLTVNYPSQLPGTYTMITEQNPSYWVYASGEQAIDDSGNLKYTEETVITYIEQDGYKNVEDTITLTSVYNEDGTYTITIPADAFQNTDTISLKVSDDGSNQYSIKHAYIAGSNLVYIPSSQSEDSYVINVTLTKPEIDVPYQDGGTREKPALVLERPIMQKVKIVKDIFVNEEGKYENNILANSGHKDDFIETAGGKENKAKYLPNFRFKIYLKSNIEQLYRAEDATVTWLDRNGNQVDIDSFQAVYPEKVQKLYTTVLHQTDPLLRRSNDAAIANTELYSYSNGLINVEQNTGYTSILETIEKKVKDSSGNEKLINGYNYEKFFDAVYVANSDKWDRTDDGSTSAKPLSWIKGLIKNAANTSNAAEENALRSDHVRQFAITWYLEDEVAKLVKQNPAGETEGISGEKYQEEIYDTALNLAIQKAENYLKPFFSYNLDKIYSIEWDSETDGGKDKDTTTLSIDLEDQDKDYCYGISEYLPYGTYVAVEQQPFDKELGDLYNKHYKIDAPKEIELPAVYENGKAGADQTPEKLSSYYNYNSSETAADLSTKYHIRFNEEWSDPGEDIRKYVIQAHNQYGDYEIYKYGLDLVNIGQEHFAITQSPLDPTKDYYNTIVDPVEDGGNPDSHYLADDKNHGVTAPNGKPYEKDAIEQIYHYGSVSEDKQIYQNVSFPADQGEEYRDNVTVMEGMQTAYDGKYASMLVPWTVTEPVDELTNMKANADGSASYQGYGYRKFRNTFYAPKLRIEKLDSETGENILHDNAIFVLYGAEREDGENTDGLVKFYEQDTLIRGSKEFLEAMGATQIITVPRAFPANGQMCTGVVPAGTPICFEDQQIILTDQEGRRTGEFEAFTTTRDGLMAEEENAASTSNQDQNTGYLITPEPLGAGSIEIYSDKVSYYLDGNKDDRVVAAIYEDEIGEGPQGIEETARIYVNNTPIRLEVSKIKDKNQTVTYKTNTRYEGTELELKTKYGTENLEFAYKNGSYLGYAYPKGTLEYLESRRTAGEAVEPVYIDGVFAGYGLITRPLDTADDTNRYIAGAVMVLYEGIEVRKNGDSGDYGYDGVEVTRDKNNNVKSIKVLEGYAGESVEFIRTDNVEGSLSGETGEGTWTYETIQRKDTDILFYSLGGLKVIETGNDGKLYGFDRAGNKVLIRNQKSIYALKNGQPILEITGGDLEQIKYSELDKCFTQVNPETLIYHLDSDKNRDAMVDPITGMAYAIDPNAGTTAMGQEKIMVWSVNVAKTQNGAIIAQDKIRTFRIATINSDTDQEYTIGTYDGQNLKKYMNPVVNEHGLPEYYQRSDETYKKGDPIYDIDGDYVRYKYDDLLNGYNKDAYSINNEQNLKEIGSEENTTDDRNLYHRQGEAWVMENTWITGEKYPNDPFKDQMTAGQADMLKRVIPGSYIMEEKEAPAGVVKSLPVGVTVKENTEVQTTEMVDEKIKVEIVKTDAADQYKLTVHSDYQKDLTAEEPKGGYGYDQVVGAHLVLYKARRIYSTDYTNYPKGYYLEKSENTPATWTVENSADNSPVTVTADWITDGSPKYFEGIPAGDYILEELVAASGQIRTTMDLEVLSTGEVQTFNLKNDHTKLEIYKYYLDSKGNMQPMPNDHKAGLALYEAKTDNQGNIITINGIPQYDNSKKITAWETDDLKEYTTVYKKTQTFTQWTKNLFSTRNKESSFLTDFEAAYKAKGNELVYITWETEAGQRYANLTESRETAQSEGITQIWTTDAGKIIRITIYRNVKNGALEEGKLPLIFEYQFNYREENGVKSYDTLEGLHRIDYLPFNTDKDGQLIGNYVLVEESTPEGYGTADPKAVILTETGDVQRYSLLNEEKFINILKVITDGINEYAAEGVTLAFYKADDSGNFMEDDQHLIDTWISGSDGYYTEEDQFNGAIPTGFGVGDLKPHRINQVQGTYYIVELDLPDYMAKRDPVKIEITADTASLYRLLNEPSQGTIEVIKMAADTGEMLSNARFKVENRDTGDYWYLTTGSDGKAKLPGLPIGEVQTDGTIKPFTYSIEEISPPDLYQISGGKKFFKFDGSDHSAVITFTYEVENQPTNIHFRKTNFDTGMAVEGAKIAVYHAVAADGKYIKDGEAIETVISGANGFTLTKKLSANQVYIMEELEAPAGFHLSKPVVFAINQAGTGIKNVENDFSILKVNGGSGAIESLTVVGRMANKVYTVLKDLDNGEELPAFVGSTDLILTEADGIKDGHLYEITEYTRYSDGNVVKSGKETKRIYLDENKTFVLPLRTYLETDQELTMEDGSMLASWTVNEANQEYIISNPITKERIIAEVIGSTGRHHEAVKKGDVTKYAITYSNPTKETVDVVIKATLISGLEYMRSTDNGTEQSGIITWTIQNAAPQTSGTVELIVVVNGDEGEMIQAEFVSGSDTTTLSNPIAPKGSLTLRNHLTGLGKNLEDQFTYEIRFTNSSGELLKGYQSYTGSVEGRIKGEGSITLQGEEFITFAGLPYGTLYEVSQKIHEDYELDNQTAAGEIVKDKAVSTVFVNNKDNEAIRELLTAGGNYKLTETTDYSDERTITSGIYRFSINASGNIDNLDMEDKLIKIYFSKVDIDTSEEIEGGHYSLIDAETDDVIYEFTKSKEKIQIPANLLTPGKDYIFREDLSPGGYAYEEEIRFTADKSGLPETIVMQDKKTMVELLKVDEDTGEIPVGGLFQIKTLEGEVVYEFVSTGEPVILEGILIAGKQYEWFEALSPDGYSYSRSVYFTVSKEPKPITVTMKDKKTEVIIKKLTESMVASPSEAQKQLTGFKIQILNKDKTPATALRDFEDFKKGQELIFTTDDQFKSVKGQLIAGDSYWLHEIEPRDGYAYAADVFFTLSKDSTGDIVIMVDKPTDVIISKKDITGEQELPGNHMYIEDWEGEIIEKWISGSKPHRITAELIAGETYFLCEESPKEGYHYAVSVPFTVSKDGSVDLVVMRNELTWVRVKKVNPAGEMIKGAALQILDAQKNAVLPYFESSDEAIDIKGSLIAGKLYYLREIKAPAGYLLSADVPFIVPYNAEIVEVTMVDRKKPDPDPGTKIPPKPKPPTQLEGKITASYNNKTPIGQPLKDLTDQKGHGEKTGDQTPIGILFTGILICLAGVGYTIKKTINERRHKKK